MRGAHVLVVEDERILAEDVSRVLYESGYVVDGIESTAEGAVERVQESAPDLVLMDIRLAGEADGIDAATAIRRSRDVPIVYLTAYADDDTLERAKLTEPLGYVLKPFEDRELQAAVELGLFRHEAERELRESEARHRSLIEDVIDASKLGLLILDDQHHVRWISRPLESYLDLNREGVVGRPATAFIEASKDAFGDPEAVSRGLYESYLGTAEVESFECRVLPSPSREERWLEHWSHSIRDGVYRGGRVGHFYDVTERKRAEDELHRVHHLEALGTLAGGIAHDFNNILTGLYGLIGLAQSRLDEEHPSFRLLDDAVHSIDRARRLSRQLLTFAEGGLPVPVTLRIPELLREVASFDLSGSNVSAVFDVAEDLWAAEADAGQVQQVFSNLVINADQAMPDGGSLHISATNERVEKGASRHLEAGCYVKISVRDEGEGIEPGHLTRVFDPYFSTKQLGRGLGLATTHSIVKKHGGHIHVDSKLRRGTTFTFYLPAASASDRARGTARRETAHPSLAARVLVMDDEELIRRTAARMLEQSGCSVAQASDGAEAIELYVGAMDASDPFDVVIMDVTVPGGMGGREAVERLLSIDPGATVLVSSGYAEDPIMAHYAEYGFKGVIEKPYGFGEMLDAIARAMSDAAH